MRSKDSGFSMIEMAMVLAVTVLVVSLTAPLVVGSRERSLEAGCRAMRGHFDDELIGAAQARADADDPWPAYAALVDVRARHHEPGPVRVPSAAACEDAPFGSPNCAITHADLSDASRPCQAMVTPRAPDARYAPGWIVRYTTPEGEDLSYDLGYHPPGATAFTAELSPTDVLTPVCHANAALWVTGPAIDHHVAHGDPLGACSAAGGGPGAPPPAPPAPPAPAPPRDPPPGGPGDPDPGDATVCHSGLTLRIPILQLTIHLLHGDLLGTCT